MPFSASENDCACGPDFGSMTPALTSSLPTPGSFLQDPDEPAGTSAETAGTRLATSTSTSAHATASATRREDIGPCGPIPAPPLLGDLPSTPINTPARNLTQGSGSSAGGARDAFDEQRSLDLTRRGRARQRVDDLEAPGLLERRERGVGMGTEVVEVERVAGIWFRHDHRAHDLAPLLVGDPDDGDLTHGRIRRECGLDLGGRDRLATSADDVACTADDGQVALVVEGSEVAGVVPAVAHRFRGRVGLIEVAVHE